MNALWLDIETTGLSLDNTILEIGMIVTTPAPEFQILAEKNWVFPFLRDKASYTDPVVQTMHDNNDLWRECHAQFMADAAPTEIEWDILAWIDTHDVDNSPMHGSTPSFDRAFLARWYPLIEKRFHYRSYDVSTLIMHGRALVPDYLKVDREKHRALPDLEDSIANAVHFRNVFLPIGGTK